MSVNKYAAVRLSLVEASRLSFAITEAINGKVPHDGLNIVISTNDGKAVVTVEDDGCLEMVEGVTVDFYNGATNLLRG